MTRELQSHSPVEKRPAELIRQLTAVLLLFFAAQSLAQTSAPPARLQGRKGAVDYSKAATTNWDNVPLGQALGYYDRLRTRELSEAAVQLADFSILRLAESSQLEMVPPREATAKARFHFESGRMYFIDRLKPREMEIQTRSAVAAILGTEFSLYVDANGRTELNLLDGKVQVSNPLGAVSLEAGDRAVVEPGQAPIKETAVLKGTNLVQWYLYYPAILDLNELGLTPAEERELAASLEAYRAGDLLAALTNYPAGRVNLSPGEQGYRAGLLLASGRVTNYATFMTSLDSDHPSAVAIRWMLAAIVPETGAPGQPPTSASQWLGHSYYLQSKYDLEGALAAAQEAVERAPRFGFGWARVGELEFSFGRNQRARQAIRRALELSPRLAQAQALEGFFRLSEGKVAEATEAFDAALNIDPRLANAWLGRGLAKFRQGRMEEGRADIQTATVMEPNRWLLRSYLAKAYGTAADRRRGEEREELVRLAFKELQLGRDHDPNDPTPLLYSALLNDQQLRVGQAIRDLEESVALNDQRRVYRSRFLLDQDLSVRSAGLAPIYQRAGLEDVSLREAARAVAYDYANYSAHLFLANSYDAFRDPTRFNLRYETVWFNELLLANLLSPVGAGALSQNISQQEYFRLFEADRVGLLTDTRYRSDGQFREVASHFGNFRRTSFAFDLDYQHNEGVRPNNELDRLEWYTTVKQQLTAQDSLLVLAKYQEYHSGDNFQYYNPASARRHFEFDEDQKPIVVAGYHREWNPGLHTLLLGGRLENDQHFSDQATSQTLLLRDTQIDPSGPIILADTVDLDVTYRSRLEIFTAEAQQVWDTEFHTLIGGGRWQGGAFKTEDRLTNPSVFGTDFPDPPAAAQIDEDFERFSAYAYETLKLPLHLRVTGGATYEHMSFPRNFRAPPVSAGQESRERLNPKGSLIWDATTNLTARGVFARSLGGASLDETFRLEPTQLAGFDQDFRTLIPESLVGSVTAPDHEIAGAALDWKWRGHTYLGVHGGVLQSEVRRSIGVFDYFFADPSPNIFPARTRENLDYEEKFVGVTLNQLITDEWAVSARYYLVRSELTQQHPSLSQLTPSVDSTNRAELHRVDVGLHFNHPSGFFARAEAQWYFQQNLGSALVGNTVENDLSDESLVQIHLHAGFRFPRQRGDITLGVLNLLDQDYRLNPVSPYYEMPRERVYAVQLRVRF